MRRYIHKHIYTHVKFICIHAYAYVPLCLALLLILLIPYALFRYCRVNEKTGKFDYFKSEE
jgi:uncharacterized membrane protein affecting hemolysin expression